MARRTDDTAIVREHQARHNADQVRAENALRGERVVAGLRLLIFAFRGISLRGVTGTTQLIPLDQLRVTLIASYGVFSLLALAGLWRAKPRASRSILGGAGFALGDFTFVVGMAYAALRNDHRFDPEMLAVALALYQSFSVVRFSWVHVALSTALACSGYALIAALAGSVLPSQLAFVLVSFFALGLLLGWLNRDINRMFLDLRRRDSLSRFLPRQVVERVLTLGEALAPVQAEVTVLFSDIRDFTTLSERLPPREVLALLDEYFVEMSQLVKAHEGIVNKFLGDGMLAIWGVPEKNPRHAELALRAALDMRTKLEELNADRVRRGLMPIRIGIGVHTGVVAAGMLGGAEQHEYTVIGDAVNLASRIEGLTKAHGLDILVSESTWSHVQGQFAGERLGAEHVKGRQEPVVVYALDGSVPMAARATGS